MKAIKKPMVIVGTGRCGSTLFFRLMALHPRLGWLSTFNEVFPTAPVLSRFSNLYRVLGLGEKVRHLPFFPKPFEAYRFWEHYLPGFSRRDRPLTAADVPGEAIGNMHQVCSDVLRHQGRERFLVKVTGWSRMAYFDRLFPDAQFVWIEREHRAVLSSWVKAGWLDVTTSPESPHWQWGSVPQPYKDLWQELGGSPLLSAALKIQLDLDDLEQDFATFRNRAMRLRFEDLVGNPREAIRQVCDFAGLEWTPDFEKAVMSKGYYDPSDKWRKHLSDEEGELVLEFFRRASEVDRTSMTDNDPRMGGDLRIDAGTQITHAPHVETAPSPNAHGTKVGTE